MNYLKTLMCMAMVAVAAMTATPAAAVHKAWFMKNSGASCVRQYPTVGNHYPGAVVNYDSSRFWVTCPITLAARPGSSDADLVAPKTWLNAKLARIHFKQTNSYFTCRARGETSGGIFYSRNVSSIGQGLGTINLIQSSTDWGGTLEAAEEGVFQQLDFECRVGTGDPNGIPSLLYGVDVATCQELEGCQGDDIETGSLTTSWVQGSGIECVPQNAFSAPLMKRTVSGYRNYDTAARVSHCPITTATDDSNEINGRTVDVANVFWEGPEVPSCRLFRYDYQGGTAYSTYFVQDPQGHLKQSGTFSTGRERSLAIECLQPPGTTIIGWKLRHTVTQKENGQ